jgi:hypothetical protein
LLRALVRVPTEQRAFMLAGRTWHKPRGRRSAAARALLPGTARTPARASPVCSQRVVSRAMTRQRAAQRAGRLCVDGALGERHAHLLLRARCGCGALAKPARAMQARQMRALPGV